MGVLPLEFLPGENAASLCLTGRETYDVEASPAGSRRASASPCGRGGRTA